MTKRRQAVLKNSLFIGGIIFFLWGMSIWNQLTIYTNSLDSYWQHVQHQLVRRYYVVLQLEKDMRINTSALNKVLDISFRKKLLQKDTLLSVQWANSVEQEIQVLGMDSAYDILVKDAQKQPYINELIDIELRLGFEVDRYNQSTRYVQTMYGRIWNKVFLKIRGQSSPTLFVPYYIFEHND